MHIKPIPKKNLIHTIGYEEFKEDDSFGELFFPLEFIENVLVQPKTEIRRTAEDEEVEIQAIVFLDAVNTPLFKPLKEKSKIHFNGRVWRVASCEHLFTFDSARPHHYEVGIV